MSVCVCVWVCVCVCLCMYAYSLCVCARARARACVRGGAHARCACECAAVRVLVRACACVRVWVCIVLVLCIVRHADGAHHLGCWGSQAPRGLRRGRHEAAGIGRHGRGRRQRARARQAAHITACRRMVRAAIFGVPQRCTWRVARCVFHVILQIIHVMCCVCCLLHIAIVASRALPALMPVANFTQALTSRANPSPAGCPRCRMIRTGCR